MELESQQHRQPSWVSVRGRLGMDKAILVSRYATAGSEKGRFILDFWRNSSFQDILESFSNDDGDGNENVT